MRVLSPTTSALKQKKRLSTHLCGWLVIYMVSQASARIVECPNVALTRVLSKCARFFAIIYLVVLSSTSRCFPHKNAWNGQLFLAPRVHFVEIRLWHNNKIIPCNCQFSQLHYSNRTSIPVRINLNLLLKLSY